MSSAQAKEYFHYQESLINGKVEGKTSEEIEIILGGLGLEKTKQVIEERALQGKCGNVLCRNVLKDDIRNYKYEGSVSFLSDGQLVSSKELDEYCSEACFLFFKTTVIPKRPAADVWELQKKLMNRSSLNLETPSSPEKGRVGLVKAVREKEVVAKPKKLFSTAPSPDGDTKLPDKLVKKKKVTFEDVEQHEQEVDDDHSSDENSSNELEMTAFIDTSFKPDARIEHSDLDSFVLIWDFLTRIATEETRKSISGKEFIDWESSSMDESLLEERRTELKSHFREGIDGCNFFASEEFAIKAKEQLNRLVTTFDLSRNIPRFQGDPWNLLTCVILGTLAESGRFPGYDFERNDIVKCFASPSLANLDYEQMETLKNALRLQ